MLRPEHESAAIRSGINRKLADDHSLHLVVKNGRGFWAYQFRGGKVIRSKGLGSASRLSLAQAVHRAARRSKKGFAGSASP